MVVFNKTKTICYQFIRISYGTFNFSKPIPRLLKQTVKFETNDIN